MAAGLDHSLFINSAETLWTMGYNSYGQLGNGMTINTNLPVRSGEQCGGGGGRI